MIQCAKVKYAHKKYQVTIKDVGEKRNSEKEKNNEIRPLLENF